MVVSLADVRAAARQLEGQVVLTPCLPSQRLSELLGCQITLKFENLQYCSSFKDRGAYVKLASLSEDERRRGVIAMSAGNHAQGVACHAAWSCSQVESVRSISARVTTRPSRCRSLSVAIEPASAW